MFASSILRVKMGNLVTIDILAGAIGNSPEYSHMNSKECVSLAEHIMNFFGYQDRIIDNVLHPAERDTFYILEDSSIMKTGLEVANIYDGREWRICYWSLSTRFIHWRARTKPIEHVINGKDEFYIYEDADAEIWNRNGTEEVLA